MRHSLISVIIPVYNVEKYLEQCLQSVINQTYKNLEIILVNDGSIDKSGEICEQYASDDSRIKVIHKVNEGLVSARKSGIKESKGKYCCFVDSDDWLELSMYEEMLELSNKYNADIVASGFILEKKSESVHYINAVPEGIYSNEKLIDKLYSKMVYSTEEQSFGISPSFSNKMFKKKIVFDCVMAVDNKITFGEDAAAVYPILLKAKRIYITSNSWYHYRQRDDSMSKELRNSYFEGLIKLKKYLMFVFSSQDNSQALIKQLNSYINMLYNYGVEKILGFSENKLWLFPYGFIEKGSNIVVYGAGAVGKSFIRQINLTEYCNVVSWIDLNFEKYAMTDYLIEDPKKLTTENFDKVIIAIKNDFVRKKVVDYFFSLGVPSHKIVNEVIKVFE